MYGFSGGLELLLLLVAMIGVGFVLLMMALVQIWAIVGTAPKAIASVRELLVARSLEQADKLCAQSLGGCLVAVSAALRAGAAARSGHLAPIDTAARDAFDAEAKKIQARWRRVLGRVMWGFTLIAVPVAMLEGNHAPALPMSLGAISILAVVLLCMRRRRSLEASLAQVRQEIVPAIAAALAAPQ